MKGRNFASQMIQDFIQYIIENASTYIDNISEFLKDKI